MLLLLSRMYWVDKGSESVYRRDTLTDISPMVLHRYFLGGLLGVLKCNGVGVVVVCVVRVRLVR